MGAEETAIAVLQEKVKTLEGQLSTMQCDTNARFDKFEGKLDQVLVEIKAGRPTWAVALIIGGLMTICTSLVVYLATH